MQNIMDLFSLTGKVAVITGGNRGIGRALSLALAQAGAAVVVVDKIIEKELIFPELKAIGARSLFIEADITDTDAVREVCTRTMAEFGQIDILVNNAGKCQNKNAEDMLPEEWDDLIKLNLNSVFYMSREIGRLMIDSGSGSIINISSMSAGIVNYPQPQCSYNASKAGVSHLTKSLAYEWAKHNIRVNAIAPGYIGTDLTKRGLSTDWGQIWEDMTPMKRVGRPEELGGLVVYLASQASSYMTGSVVLIDGGYSVL